VAPNFKKPKLRPRYSRKKEYHHVNVDCASSVNTESHMECSTRNPEYPSFASHSQDSLILQRCLFHHQISIQQLLHQLRKEDTARCVKTNLRRGTKI
jgi:hypothetical protein